LIYLVSVYSRNLKNE
ncbi:tRNA (guanine-N1)-methyltransferase, partial [Vibrio harveyi]